MKWLCNKCENIIYEAPLKNSTCKSCNKGRYKTIVTCKCGIEFQASIRKQVFCSKECQVKYIARGGKKGKKYPHTQKARIGICEVCGKEFRAVNDYGNRKQKYCSKECWRNRRIDKTSKCLYCNNEIKYSIAPSCERKFCSRKCAEKYHIGENAPAYKDGKSSERERARYSDELTAWRKSVYKRDNYTCQSCGITGIVLHAHHMKEFSKYPDLRTDINNGITLCIKCHGKIHNKDFSNRLNKKCIVCNAKTSGQSKTGYCRSCATKAQHTRKRNMLM